MQKLSLLVFSRNDISQAIGLIKDLYSVVDDVVLLDSSDAHNRKRLAQETKSMKKLRVFYVVAMGYPDPMFLYSVRKCKSEWVIMLGMDERLTKDLKSGIRKIIGQARCSAFAIKRYEEDAHGNKKENTWQIRLFKRDNVSFKGLLHEQPQVDGRTEQLPEDQGYIRHVEKLMTEGTDRQYNKMQKYERFTYRMYHDKVLEYLNKAGLSGTSKALLIGFLKAYHTIALRDRNKDRKVVAKAGLIFRFDNTLNKIKEIYDSKTLGKIQFMRFTWEFSRKPMENVDIIWDLTPHIIDMYTFFTGDEPYFVGGFKTQFRRSDKSELANIVLSDSKNIKALLNISWFATAKNRIIEIFGDKRVLRADLIAQTITLFDADDTGKSEQIQVPKNNTIRAEAMNLIENAMAKKNTVNPISIGVKETVLIDEINKKVHHVQ